MPEFRQKLNALANGLNKDKPGMVSEVKNLYQGKKDSRGRHPWVETKPDDLAEPVENEKSARYALLIRNVVCYDGKRSLAIDSIIIQSPLVRDALERVLDNYPGITPGIDRMEIRPKFQSFVHRWDKFESVLQNEQDVTTKAHLQMLHDVLYDEISDDLRARDNLVAHKVIDFSHLWMLFEPGCLVYSSRLGQPCAMRLESCTLRTIQGQNVYQLSCEYVEWDGAKFGHATTCQTIHDYQGTCPIAKLSSFPMKYHPDLAGVTAKLIARGKEFERLAGYHYRAYRGLAIGKGLFGQVAYNVNSRVIIDTYAWNRFNPNEQVNTNPFKDSSMAENRFMIDRDEDEDEYDCEDYEGMMEEDQLGAVREALEPKKSPKIKALTDDQRLLCTNTLKGYALKDKKWLTLFIESVQDIHFGDHAFSRLVLPEDQKELILALTESQRDNRSQFEDVIQGKGMGMIMLLSGPPGVGKTLTAESVAENMRAPLYRMSAGDLGTKSEDVESRLSNVLEMCTKWKAILLLDEADVFLEQRTAHDLERNKLVSIFLRILEYYEGILFLTTNRVEHIDAAFQSRIHVSMSYNELTAESRRTVWDNLLNGASSQANEIGEEELDKLASFPMNGREIKNVFKTAQLLASKKNVSLALGHIKTVLGIEKRYLVE